MTEAIIVACTTGAFALLGTYLTVNSGNKTIMAELKTHPAVQDEKIDSLTKEVRKHNDFATRIPILEEGASCDVFVGTCVRSAGIDSKFPRGLSPSYLAKSSKFKQVKVTTKTIQDGDIIVTSKHICIAYGGKVKEASNGDFYPKTTNYLAKRLSASGAKVYRAK